MKQETIEQAGAIALGLCEHLQAKEQAMFIAGFQECAKWQAERSYSEEDMISFAWFLLEHVGEYSCDQTAHFEGKYLEQFKNK